LAATKHFSIQYPFVEMFGNHQAFFHPISLCKNAWQPLGIYVPIIPLQQHLEVAKHLYTHYPYGKMHGSH
jgi:hypothetical protein